MGCFGGGGNSAVQPLKTGSNAEFKFEGPIRDRQCRDVIALLIFFLFLCLLGFVIFYAVDKGNPNLLIYGTDSWGNVCHQKNSKIDGATYSGQDTTGLRKLFYFNEALLQDVSTSTTPKITSGSVCTTECPGALADVAELQEFATNGSKLCRYDITIASYFDGSDDGTDTCPAVPIAKTSPVLNRCVSDSLSNILDKIGQALSDILDKIDNNFTQKCGEDLQNYWLEIIYLVLISVGVSLVLVILMRFIAPVIVWLVVLLMVLACLVLIAFGWYSYYKQRTDMWLGIAIGLTVVGGITLLILLILRKRIALVVQLFRESGKVVARVPQLLLQPFVTLIILGGVSAALVYVFLYIVTARDPSVNTATSYVSWKQDESMKGMVIIYLLGFIWLTQFIIGCERLTVSSTVAMWFFTRNKKNLSWPIFRSVGRLIRYHLGSVAFGSLIIAIVVLIRLILSFIHKRLSGSESAIAKFFLKCLICCLWCFEKILKFLTANAYIQIAINGYSFCKAARTAFMVIVSNALRVTAINSVGDFVLFLAKAATVAVVAVVGIELFRDKSDLNYVWLPITVGCIISYFVAACFFGLYELIIDAIFMCFVEDCDRNDGIEKPYFMSKGLMEFVKNASEAKKMAAKRDED